MSVIDAAVHLNRQFHTGTAVVFPIVLAPLGAIAGAGVGGAMNLYANGKSADTVDDSGKNHSQGHHYIANCAAIGAGLGVVGPIAGTMYNLKRTKSAILSYTENPRKALKADPGLGRHDRMARSMIVVANDGMSEAERLR